MDAKADQHSGDPEAQPAETVGEEREVVLGKTNHGLGPAGVADQGRGGVDHVEDGGDQRQASRNPVNQRIGVEERRGDSEDDQSDCQWVEEHQNRRRPGDDLVQSHVCNQEGQEAVKPQEGLVGNPWEAPVEVLGEGNNQAHRTGHAGNRRQGGEDGVARGPHVVVGNLTQRGPAVGSQAEVAETGSPQPGQAEVDDGDAGHAEQAALGNGQ